MYTEIWLDLVTTDAAVHWKAKDLCFLCTKENDELNTHKKKTSPQTAEAQGNPIRFPQVKQKLLTSSEIYLFNELQRALTFSPRESTL